MKTERDSTFKGENMEKKGEETDKLKAKKIKDGTVIDHIGPGLVLDCCRILGITSATKETVIIAMRVVSKVMKEGKDILKIEGRTLKPSEADRIAIIAPRATINIIKEFKVVKKTQVKIPKVISGIIKCPNPACISVSEEPKEPVATKFYPKYSKRTSPSFQCHYCGYIIMTQEDLIKALI